MEERKKNKVRKLMQTKDATSETDEDDTTLTPHEQIMLELAEELEILKKVKRVSMKEKPNVKDRELTPGKAEIDGKSSDVESYEEDDDHEDYDDDESPMKIKAVQTKVGESESTCKGCQSCTNDFDSQMFDADDESDEHEDTEEIEVEIITDDTELEIVQDDRAMTDKPENDKSKVIEAEPDKPDNKAQEVNDKSQLEIKDKKTNMTAETSQKTEEKMDKTEETSVKTRDDDNYDPFDVILKGVYDGTN